MLMFDVDGNDIDADVDVVVAVVVDDDAASDIDGAAETQSMLMLMFVVDGSGIDADVDIVVAVVVDVGRKRRGGGGVRGTC